MAFTLDAAGLRQMYISANNRLCNQKEILNELNVFPVPDGDTGSNMSMTVLAATRELMEGRFATCEAVALAVARSSLRGARGNSGVILSQFFRGIAKRLAGCELVDATDIAEAFTEGVENAYRAVMKPTEGTMLTVARDGAKAGMQALEETGDLTELLRAVTTAAQHSLDRTPDILPQLKAAGVVDSGGQGVVYLLEGALSFAETGEVVPLREGDLKASIPAGAQAAEADIPFQYCTEFIIQKDNPAASSKLFTQNIQKKGDSMVVVDDGEIIKVHIHTNNPGAVIERALKLGQLINIKVDNMKYQHTELSAKAPKDAPASESAASEKPFGFVAVAAGDGLRQIFSDMGVDEVVEGGQTMNPSTEDILEAVERVPSETVFVLPNNKNIVMAAKQCVDLSKKAVHVIATRSVPAGISAVLAFDPQKGAAENEAAMEKAVGRLHAGSVTYAVRDTTVDGKQIKKGDILGMAEGKIVQVGSEPGTVLTDVVSAMAKDDSEIISVFYGEDVPAEEAALAEESIEEKFPDCDVLLHRGGQPLYHYIVSVE